MMQQGPSTEDPVKWSTRFVVAWMRSYDDSREEVKKKILEVVETNDIDGLMLKQLRADSEEIHTLFPSLKDRLTFKAMLRDIFKDVRCSHCYSNGGSIGNACSHEPPTQKHTPTQAPLHAQQLSSKSNSITHAVTNHRNAANHAHNEETNHKPSGHLSRTSPLLSPRPHQLPRQDSKENTQSAHGDNGQPTSRSKLPPLAVAMVPNAQPVLSPRERELNSAQMHRFMSPQGIHSNQMMPHGAPAVSFPFAPIAGQFNVSVANQALAAALAARALPHQQPYQQQHQQQISVASTASTSVGSSQAATSRAAMYPPPNHHHHRSIAPATTSAPPPPPTVTQRIVEILSKDDKDLPVASTSSASPSEHPQNSQQSTSSQVPVTMPLMGTRGRPATKGAIRSAKISQKYKKIIQRMKSAHKQVIEIPYPAPLPSFSQLLRQQIGRGNIANFRSRFTYECAQYYMSLNPTPSHTEYRNISKTIVENFPVLSSPDEDVPWRKFNNQLSQAIRNIRRQLRSVPNSGYPPAQKRKYWRNLASQFMCNGHNGMTLSHLTQQQQQQLGLVGTSGEQGNNHGNDDNDNDDDDDDDDNIIILKEEDDDDDDDGERGDEENEDGDVDDGNYDESDVEDSVVPAEWANKHEARH